MCREIESSHDLPCRCLIENATCPYVDQKVVSSNPFEIFESMYIAIFFYLFCRMKIQLFILVFNCKKWPIHVCRWESGLCTCLKRVFFSKHGCQLLSEHFPDLLSDVLRWHLDVN
jgi:hypothetical protein